MESSLWLHGIQPPIFAFKMDLLRAQEKFTTRRAAQKVVIRRDYGANIPYCQRSLSGKGGWDKEQTRGRAVDKSYFST